VDAGDRLSGVRLAELVAALSLATDLGLGLPQEHVLRQTVIARRLAAAARLPDEQQTAVFYVSLLAWVGCVADSHELATWFGDDQRLRADSYQVDKTGMPMLRFVLGHVGDGSGPVRRLTMIGRFLAGGPERATSSMLGRLAEIGALAGLHHERIDGSGYPRGVHGDGLSLSARVVATADAYHAMCEGRPHRAARGAAEAAAALRDEAVAGRLDGEAVNAVLAAAGHRVRHRPALPYDLTPREAEILALLARGLSNKEMAQQLSVSARTVSSHVEHTYAKIGVSTRGAAAMFAMRYGLVDSRAGT